MEQKRTEIFIKKRNAFQMNYPDPTILSNDGFLEFSIFHKP